MKSIEFAGDPIRAAAWLYYANTYTQSEVANALGVSRQTVANYLSEARERGLVTIQLEPDILAKHELATKLKSCLGLQGVHVVPATSDQDELRQNVGRAGAEVLCSLMRDGDIIGVSSGRTLSAVAKTMPKASFPRSTIIQVSGSSIFATQHSPEVCASDIATSISARCLNLHAPAFLSSQELTERLYLEPALKEHFKTISMASILAFGIGELTEQTVVEQPPYLNGEVRDQYIRSGAKAIVFDRFLGCEGQEVPGALSGRTVAISLDTAKLVPTRLGVCGGTQKVEAVQAAISAGLITHLVLDASLACALLGKIGAK
tara:strand:- start:3532 stop:4485 length:954 start_codon:yes stop_codon:yes gene_type:complete